MNDRTSKERFVPRCSYCKKPMRTMCDECYAPSVPSSDAASKDKLFLGDPAPKDIAARLERSLSKTDLAQAITIDRGGIELIVRALRTAHEPSEREQRLVAAFLACREKLASETGTFYNAATFGLLPGDIPLQQAREAAFRSATTPPRAPEPPSALRPIGIKQRSYDGRSEFLWWECDVPEGATIYASVAASETKECGHE